MHVCVCVFYRTIVRSVVHMVHQDCYEHSLPILASNQDMREMRTRSLLLRKLQVKMQA